MVHEVRETQGQQRPGAIESDRRTQSAPDTTAQPDAEQPPLRNSQSSRNVQPARARASEQFNRRFDGPFVRPSVTMSRRKSNTVRDSEEFNRRYDGPYGRPTREDERSEEPSPAGNAIEVSDVPSDLVLGFQPTPPKLNYSLRTRKLSICIFWATMILDSVLIPLSLYYGIWYGVGPGAKAENKKLSANVTVSIVTAAIGGASILEYILRFWRLWKKGSTCRVIGAHRWYLDWFHWSISLAWIVVMIELIVGTIPDHPPIRLISMPLPSVLFVFGSVLLFIDVLRFFHVPAPVRISSVPKGAQLRPGIYSYIEDACAVDGNGGTAFREAFNRRYEASHTFRLMLRQLGIFWAVGAEACAAFCTGLIFGLETIDAAYAIGWSVPPAWATFWTVATFWYVKRQLRKERKAWTDEAAKGRVESV